MSQKRHTPEQIINKLRQAEVELARGATVPQACKKIGVTGRLITGGGPSMGECGWTRPSG